MRGRIDRGVQAAVTASGLMVLMTLMLIFVYLLFAVLPLFKPASLGQAQPLPIAASAPALALGMDVQQRVGYRIDAQGAGQFYRLTPTPNGQPQAPLAQQTLLAKPALLAQAAGERDLFALAQADGRLVVARGFRDGGDRPAAVAVPARAAAVGAGSTAQAAETDDAGGCASRAVSAGRGDRRSAPGVRPFQPRPAAAVQRAPAGT